MVGERVTVPLGVKNRYVSGYVLGEDSYAGELKEVISRSGEIFFDRVRAALALWIWENFYTSARSLLRSLLVPLILEALVEVRLSLNKNEYIQLLDRLSGYRGYSRLLSCLYDRGGSLPLAELPGKNLLNRVLKKGWAHLERLSLMAAEISQDTLDARLYWAPWEKQVDFLLEELRSGKGEVRQSLLIVPEKSLMATLEGYLQKKGIDLHLFSADSPMKDRLAAVKKAQGQKNLMLLGTWSALFLPFTSLGRILVLHEESKRYRLNHSPSIQVVRTAEALARLSGARLRLFSCTPSLDSFMHTFSWLKPIRIPRPFPARRRVVLAREGLSPFIRRAILKTSSAGKRTMIFLNRRGFANLIICEDCGEDFTCPICSVAMTPHREELVCHYCGHSIPIPLLCPRCGGAHLCPKGLGLEGLEEILGEDGIGQKVFRIDAGITPNQVELARKLGLFRQSRGGILLATGALIGSFLPRVSLLVILNLDFLLRLPDFKATERAYQLLHNLEPLAGEELILQVSNSYGIKELLDDEGFYRRELGFRKETSFPPHRRLLRLLFLGKKEEEIWETARSMRSALEETTLRGQLSGPLEAVHYRLRGFWRVEILSRFPLGPIPPEVRELLRNFSLRKGMQMQVELEPEELL